MTNKPKRYCTGIDCAWCGEKEPCIYRIANRLEEENVNLKAELEETKTLKDMYFTFYKAKHDDIKGVFFKYRQTLTEIKEIAESDEYIGFWDEQISQILQKCNEVLDE